MSLAVVEILILSTSLLVGRNVFGHVFSSDKETIDYVAKMAPLVSISLILDGLQGVLSGSRLVPISVLKHKLLSDIVYPLFLQSLMSPVAHFSPVSKLQRYPKLLLFSDFCHS